MKNIVLIGFKKSGKTTLGKLLAKTLAKPFIDTDAWIEELYFRGRLEKKSVYEIYKDVGEDFFRSLESLVIGAVAEEKGVVIATGGGSLLSKNNTEALKKNGFFVFLDAPLDLLEKRIRSSSSYLNGKTLAPLFEERRKLCLQWADLQVLTGKKNGREILTEIIEGIHGKQ
jgi:shikimate kinase